MISSAAFPNPAVAQLPRIAIFLDVDEVLTQKTYGSFMEMPKTLEERKQATDFFNQKSVKRLDKIINGLEKTHEVWVIISSSWRLGFTVEELKKIFSHYQFSHYIRGKTIDSDDFSMEDRKAYCNEDLHKNRFLRCRAAEIQKFLTEHPEIIDYVILDDTNDHLDRFAHRYVQVNPTTLITKGIKNYILGHLFGEGVLPEIKEKIMAKQRLRAEKPIAYHENAPRVMEFYPYPPIGDDRQEVNCLAAAQLADLWTYVLTDEVSHFHERPEQTQKEAKSQEAKEPISEEQFKTYQLHHFNRIYDYLENRKVTCILPLATHQFNEALAAASISSYQRNPFTSPCNLNMTVSCEADGIQITVHPVYHRVSNRKTKFWL